MQNKHGSDVEIHDTPKKPTPFRDPSILLVDNTTGNLNYREAKVLGCLRLESVGTEWVWTI